MAWERRSGVCRDSDATRRLANFPTANDQMRGPSPKIPKADDMLHFLIHTTHMSWFVLYCD